MKPERNYLEVESTLEGEDVMMGIDLSNMGHLMNVLTDLYEDRELACIREYATNALDANREVGSTAPIVVELPGPLRQVFSVRDEGPGLDKDDIKTIYSQYGASTKRDTNEAVGMLGLGCKSALTYTDQFTIVSVKDGVRTTVSVSRDDAGAGVMKVLAEDTTTDRNGTTIQIPTRRDNGFEAKAKDFFRFWERGTVEVDGAEPDGLGGLALSDDIHVLPERGNDWIVMGNVPYPADLRIYDAWSDGVVVARVPIGAVNFTPSREALMDTDRTTGTLNDVKRRFRDLAKDGVQKAVDAAPDRAGAMAAYVEANTALPSSYRVEPEAMTFNGEHLPVFGKLWWGSSLSRSGYKSGNAVATLPIHSAAEAFWVAEYGNAEWTGANRKKLQMWMEANQPDQDRTSRPVVLIDTKTVPNPAWISDESVVAWPEVRKWQPPRDPNAPARPKVTGTYNAYPDDGYIRAIQATDLPTDKTLFWVQGRKYAFDHLQARLASLSPKAVMVVLPSTRVEKFKRDFPKARNAKEFIRAGLEKRVKQLTRDESIALAFHGNRTVGKFTGLPPEKLDDPELSQVVRWAKAATDADSYLKVGLQQHNITLPHTTDLFSVCTKRYPLLDAVNYAADPDDLTLYANAAYAASKE